MKKAFRVLLLMSILPIIQMYAQTKSGITLELLYKKEFGELTVGPEGFPPPEIKQILLDKDIPQEDRDWLLNSLRIEIARREKVLYPDDGRAISLPEDLRHIFATQNMRYVVVYCYDENTSALGLRDMQYDARKRALQWQKEWEQAHDEDIQVLWDSVHYWVQIRDSLDVLLNKIARWYTTRYILIRVQDGATLWEKEDLALPRHIYISNDGKTVVVIPAGSRILTSAIFCDEKGNEERLSVGQYGISGCHDMSSDGEMFCVISRRSPVDTSPIGVASYNNKGARLWLKEVQGISPFTNPSIAVSPNHKYVAVSLTGEKWWREAYTTLLDWKGNIISTLNCCAYHPVFSSDGEYLALASDRDTVYFVSTEDGSILWQKWIANLSGTCSISYDGEYLYVNSNKTPYESYLINRDGHLLVTMAAHGTMSPHGRILLTSMGIYVTRGPE